MALRRAIIELISVLLLMVISAPAISADWQGSATLGAASVRANFSERFAVTVTNSGTVPLEITSIDITIGWSGLPTLYRVFEGSAIIAPGGSGEFLGPSTRMPNVAAGTYPCFVGVTAKGSDGQAVERRFYGSIVADRFSVSLWGVPEEVLVPGLLTLAMVALTIALFSWERTEGWPFFRARPRWTAQRSRRR